MVSHLDERYRRGRPHIGILEKRLVWSVRRLSKSWRNLRPAPELTSRVGIRFVVPPSHDHSRVAVWL